MNLRKKIILRLFIKIYVKSVNPYGTKKYTCWKELF